MEQYRGSQELFKVEKATLYQRISLHPLLFFSVVHIIIFLGVATLVNYYSHSNPDSLERWFAVTILQGHQIPYRDFICEYPPLTLLNFLIPGLFFHSPFSFNVAFAAEMLAADIIVLVLISKLASRLNLQIWDTLRAYTLLILAVSPLLTTRHDIVAAMLVLAAIYAFVSGKNKTTWVLIGLGTMSKIFPIILAPLLGLYLLKYRQYSDLMKGAGILVGAILIISIPWLILDANGYLQFVAYHADRGLQSETSYASVLLVGQLLGLDSVKGIANYGSWNLTSPTADTLAKLSPYIVLGLMFILYLAFTRIIWRKQGILSQSKFIDGDKTALILRFSALAILILLLTDKVFSPQYLIWVCPLLPLLCTRWRITYWIIFVIIGMLTQWVYPFHYTEFELGQASPIIIEAVRNCLLLGLTLLVAWPSRFFPGLFGRPVGNVVLYRPSHTDQDHHHDNNQPQ